MDFNEAHSKWDKLDKKGVELSAKKHSLAYDDPQREEIAKLQKSIFEEQRDIYLTVYALAKTDAEREWIENEFSELYPLHRSVFPRWREKMHWRIEEIRATNPVSKEFRSKKLYWENPLVVEAYNKSQKEERQATVKALLALMIFGVVAAIISMALLFAFLE